MFSGVRGDPFRPFSPCRSRCRGAGDVSVPSGGPRGGRNPGRGAGNGRSRFHGPRCREAPVYLIGGGLKETGPSSLLVGFLRPVPHPDGNPPEADRSVRREGPVRRSRRRGRGTSSENHRRIRAAGGVRFQDPGRRFGRDGNVEGRRRVRSGGDADPPAAGKRRKGVAPEGGEDPGGRTREGGCTPPEKMTGRKPRFR